jgi:hypothetical protein
MRKGFHWNNNLCRRIETFAPPAMADGGLTGREFDPERK